MHVQAGWLTLVIVVGDNAVKLYQCLKLLVRLMELVSEDPCGTENSFISHTVKVNQKLNSVLGLGLLMWVVCV